MIKLQIKQGNGTWGTLNTRDARGLSLEEKQRTVAELARMRDSWVATLFPLGAFQIIRQSEYNNKWSVVG